MLFGARTSNLCSIPYTSSISRYSGQSRDVVIIIFISKSIFKVSLGNPTPSKLPFFVFSTEQFWEPSQRKQQEGENPALPQCVTIPSAQRPGQPRALLVEILAPAQAFSSSQGEVMCWEGRLGKQLLL
jgi:hypothetical protein